MGIVRAVCISPAKGTQKTNVGSAEFIEEFGIKGDAHAGKWHRQVSLLSNEKIEAFRARGAEVKDGAFGENLVVEGFDFKNLPVGTRFQCNDVILEMTQIVEKNVITDVRSLQKMGDCIMPRRRFCKGTAWRTISSGDELYILEVKTHGRFSCRNR